MRLFRFPLALGLMLSLTGCPQEVGQCILDIIAPSVGAFCRSQAPLKNSIETDDSEKSGAISEGGDPIFELLGSISAGADAVSVGQVPTNPSKQQCQDFLDAYRTCSNASSAKVAKGVESGAPASAQFAMTSSDEDCLNRMKSYCCKKYGKGVAECQ